MSSGIVRRSSQNRHVESHTNADVRKRRKKRPSTSITFALNCQTVAKSAENRLTEGKIDQNQNLDPVEPKLESASSAAESLFADVEKEITFFVVYSHS